VVVASDRSDVCYKAITAYNRSLPGI
jgi:hypothetical protein